jgi:CRISPR/Cas system-associated exonuclease Cas4 (RecB family)
MKSHADDDAYQDTGYVHASEMAKADWCPRETWFRIMGEKVSDPQANPSFQMESIFEEGHEIHRKWQGWLWEMGVLYGWWYCHGCEHYWEALSPSTCPECGEYKDIIEFKEVPVTVEEYRFLGHADGAVHDGKGKILIEVKSIGVGTLRFEAPTLHAQYLAGMDIKDIWKKIRRPFASHLIQGNLYLWAMPEYEAIVFIYEYKPNQSVKEFVIRRNESLIAWRLSACKDIVRGLRSGFPPYRPNWATEPDGPKCKSCVYRSACWGLERATDAGEEEQHQEKRRVLVRQSTGGVKGAKRRAASAG